MDRVDFAQGLKNYGEFAEIVNFAYGFSCIGNGLNMGLNIR